MIKKFIVQCVDEVHRFVYYKDRFYSLHHNIENELSILEIYPADISVCTAGAGWFLSTEPRYTLIQDNFYESTGHIVSFHTYTKYIRDDLFIVGYNTKHTYSSTTAKSPVPHWPWSDEETREIFKLP